MFILLAGKLVNKEMTDEKNAQDMIEKTSEKEIATQEILVKKWYLIDNSMVVAKLAFVCSSATFSSFEPYLLLILISVGLDPFDAGLVGGLRFIGGVIGANIWGLIADYKKCHQIIVLIICSGALLSMGAQPFVILWLGTSSGNVCPTGNNNQSTGNYTMEKAWNNENVNEKHLFYAMLLVNTIVKFFDSAYKGFLDSGVIERCRINPRNPNFGFQRMFGAVGSAIGVSVANIFVDYFPESSVSCYTGVFIAYTLFTLVLLFLTQLLFSGLTFTMEGNNEVHKVKVRKLLMKTLDAHAFFFLATVLMMGTQQSFYVNFTFLLLREMNAPSIIYGLNMAVAALASASFFFAGRYIIDKLGGTWPAMIASVFAYFIRFIAIASVENPWLLPLIQTLQSFCYGLFLTAAVLHIKNIARPEIRTTMYAIMNSLHFGVGIIIANTLGGKLYKNYGGKNLFIIASMTALMWTIFSAIYFLVFVKFKLFDRWYWKTNTKETIHCKCLQEQGASLL